MRNSLMSNLDLIVKVNKIIGNIAVILSQTTNKAYNQKTKVVNLVKRTKKCIVIFI